MSTAAAFVTLLTSDKYLPGALVLGAALHRQHHTRHQVVCLIPSEPAAPSNEPAPVSDESVAVLSELFDAVVRVPLLESHDPRHLHILGRPELGPTFTKIHAWNLTQYRRVCFLDADCLPVRNVDELLDEHGPFVPFAAAPDSGWPDCFNSGVMIIEPSHDEWLRLSKLADEAGSFDGADQGLLNRAYPNWREGGSNRRLPFTYNCTPSALYSYVPAFREYSRNIAIMHFIGTLKPWHWDRLTDGSVKGKGSELTDLLEYVQLWWNIYDRHVSSESKDQISDLRCLGWSSQGGWQQFHSRSVPPSFSNNNDGNGGNNDTDFGNFRVDWDEEEAKAVPRSRPGTASSFRGADGRRLSLGRLNVDDDDDEGDAEDDDDEHGAERLRVKLKASSGADMIPGPYPAKKIRPPSASSPKRPA